MLDFNVLILRVSCILWVIWRSQEKFILYGYCNLIIIHAKRPEKKSFEFNTNIVHLIHSLQIYNSSCTFFPNGRYYCVIVLDTGIIKNQSINKTHLVGQKSLYFFLKSKSKSLFKKILKIQNQNLVKNDFKNHLNWNQAYLCVQVSLISLGRRFALVTSWNMRVV